MRTSVACGALQLRVLQQVCQFGDALATTSGDCRRIGRRIDGEHRPPWSSTWRFAMERMHPGPWRGDRLDQRHPGVRALKPRLMLFSFVAHLAPPLLTPLKVSRADRLPAGRRPRFFGVEVDSLNSLGEPARGMTKGPRRNGLRTSLRTRLEYAERRFRGLCSNQRPPAESAIDPPASTSNALGGHRSQREPAREGFGCGDNRSTHWWEDCSPWTHVRQGQRRPWINSIFACGAGSIPKMTASAPSPLVPLALLPSLNSES